MGAEFPASASCGSPGSRVEAAADGPGSATCCAVLFGADEDFVAVPFVFALGGALCFVFGGELTTSVRSCALLAAVGFIILSKKLPSAGARLRRGGAF